ncbi:MAG: zf-HC2 domain-containing protein [Bryobacteraceae bacterium]
MRTKRSHLSDEEILLFIDRELPSRRHLRARFHLAECPSCGSRKTELEATLSEFSRIHEETANSLDANLSRSRSLLKARIAETAVRNRRRASGLLQAGSLSWQLACAGIALIIVSAGYWLTHEFKWNDRGSQSIESQAFALPRRKLTPGAVIPIAVDELCRTTAVDNDPPVNPTVQQAVFREYGLPNSSGTGYALDYLITPALGGSGDIKNLWPQPSSSTWNARVKDQLEDHLHELVCQGKVQLTTAQNEIATDWISAYKRYFHTDKPQPSPATLAAVKAKRRSHAGIWHNQRISAWRVPATIVRGWGTES